MVCVVAALQSRGSSATHRSSRRIEAYRVGWLGVGWTRYDCLSCIRPHRLAFIGGEGRPPTQQVPWSSVPSRFHTSTRKALVYRSVLHERGLGPTQCARLHHCQQLTAKFSQRVSALFARVRKSRIMHKNGGPGFIGLVLCIIYVHNASHEIRLRTGIHGWPERCGAGGGDFCRPEPTRFSGRRPAEPRPTGQQLHRVLNDLDEGDVLLVTRLDRLARSTRDLLNTLALIADKKAALRSLGDKWADTTTAHGRLMLTVLAGLAEFERELIRARTGEGRARAKARGVKLGRKFKLTLHQQKEARARRERGDTLMDIARSYNVSHSTISRLST